ncbi:MAG: hypothetical protein RL322_970 [Pseudomonadota bacterium]|jgi:GT2 family glycosyltransferase
MTPIRFVCATRLSAAEFETGCALGRSLALYRSQFGALFQTRLFAENAEGLPTVYNRAIDESDNHPALLVFIHDDVWLTDLFWPSRFHEALTQFDLVGVAGSRRRLPGQLSWGLVRKTEGSIGWDDREYLSGCVAHGPRTETPVIQSVGHFGPARVEVKLLDGVLMLAHSQTLIQRGLRFDPRFDFHFYDLDLCRQAEQIGLRMGTWDLSLIHCSEGSFQDPRWLTAYQTYLQKWGT